MARIKAFSYSGFSVKVNGNIAYHYQSFVGRDYKAWSQMAVFTIDHYVTESEKNCWLLFLPRFDYLHVYVIHKVMLLF